MSNAKIKAINRLRKFIGKYKTLVTVKFYQDITINEVVYPKGATKNFTCISDYESGIKAELKAYGIEV